jgi:hypothetical protein
MKFHTLTFNNEIHELSLSRHENHEKSLEDALDHISTDHLILRDGHSVQFYKDEFKRLKALDPSLKQMPYLNSISKKKWGLTWDFMIKETKNCVLELFRHTVNKRPKERFAIFEVLAGSGHTQSCFLVAESYSAINNVHAVEWYVLAHNLGHTHALFCLSHYFSRNNYNAHTVECLILSADLGNYSALLTIPSFHSLQMVESVEKEYLSAQLSRVMEEVPFSSARIIKLYQCLLNDEADDAHSILQGILQVPERQPKSPDIDIEFQNRNALFIRYFQLLDDSLFFETKLIAPKELIRLFIQEQAALFSFSDLDKFFADKKIIDQHLESSFKETGDYLRSIKLLEKAMLEN